MTVKCPSCGKYSEKIKHRTICYDCIKKQCRDNYRKKIEHNRSQSRKYYWQNREKEKEDSRKYRESHKEYYRKHSAENYYRKFYGITLAQKEQMRIAQDNKCAICGNEFKNNEKCCIDHNHNNKKLRQLLCSRCNLGIGIFEEDIELLQKVIRYLYKWLNPSNEMKENGDC